MSRIETKHNTAITQAPQNGDLAKSSKLNNAATPLAIQRFTNIREKFEGKQKISSKKSKRIVFASDIAETDLQPLSGKNRDQMMAELSRILVSIVQYDEARGEDETSQLFKVMVNEHVRRLSLITATEVNSDGLRGSA